MYGNSSNVNIENGRVFNITSLKQEYIRLPSLIPPNSIGRFTGKDFDISYANYIFSNDFVFFEFFNIIYTLYLGLDVYLVFSDEEWSENLAESLLKLIQQRYGYNGVKINSLEDYIFYSQSNDSGFGNFGPSHITLNNLDMDKDRFAYIGEKIRLQGGNNQCLTTN